MSKCAPRQSFTVGEKEEWLSRADQMCEICGYMPSKGALKKTWMALTFHHCLPVSLGGTNASANMIVLCPTCDYFADRLAFERDKNGKAGKWTRCTLKARVASLMGGNRVLQLREDLHRASEGWREALRRNTDLEITIAGREAKEGRRMKHLMEHGSSQDENKLGGTQRERNMRLLGIKP